MSSHNTVAVSVGSESLRTDGGQVFQAVEGC